MPRPQFDTAVGWETDVAALSGELHLPPGWRLLWTHGVDRAPTAWLPSWTLWDIFLVVISVVLALRLLGRTAAALVALTAGTRLSGTGSADARLDCCCYCCLRVLRIGRGRFGQFARLSYFVVFAFTVIAVLDVRDRQLPDGDLSATRERRLRRLTSGRAPSPHSGPRRRSSNGPRRIPYRRSKKCVVTAERAKVDPAQAVRSQHAGADRSRRADMAVAQRDADLGRPCHGGATNRSGAVAAVADTQPSRRSARSCCCCWLQCSAAPRCRPPLRMPSWLSVA